MSTVYLLVHVDYDDTQIRGVYATRELGEADIVTTTDSGRPSVSVFAHHADCCHVHEWEVLEAANPDVREDDPPFDPANSLVPTSFYDAIVRVDAAQNPYRRLSR